MSAAARLLAVALLLGAGCTFLTHFDPEGQPCDTAAPPASQCLDGFHCENGKCRAGAYVDDDAGTSSDGG
jgi:hypothetical protein